MGEVDFCNDRPGAMVLRPVGIIRNRIEKPFLAAGEKGIEMQGQIDDVMNSIHEINKEKSEVIINEDLAEILDGIEEYSHIVL